MISLPYSKSKRYLTGIDWMINTLDHITKKETGTGNICQAVLEIDGLIDDNRLESLLQSFIAIYPVLSGRCRRDYNLAPYWHTPKKTRMVDFDYQRLTIEDDECTERVFEILSDEVNSPFKNKTSHVAFSLLLHKGKSYFALKFDHQLFDAHGAEIFLAAFSSFCAAKTQDPPDLLAPAHLDHWKDKFDAGQRVNRMMMEMREIDPPASIPLPTDRKKRRSVYSLKSYSIDETARITELATEKAGYLMMMTFLLGATTWCMQKAFKSMKLDGRYFIIPVNLDARSKVKNTEQMFFNPLSFLYFKFASTPADSIDSLWTEANRQLYDSTGSGISKDIEKAAMLMRILPVGIIGKLMKLHFKGVLATFSFSFTGKSGYESEQFMDQPVVNLHHMPRVPAPPGLGVFFTSFNGRLNTVFSHVEGTIPEKEIATFMKRLDTILTSGKSDD